MGRFHNEKEGLGLRVVRREQAGSLFKSYASVVVVCLWGQLFYGKAAVLRLDVKHRGLPTEIADDLQTVPPSSEHDRESRSPVRFYLLWGVEGAGNRKARDGDVKEVVPFP